MVIFVIRGEGGGSGGGGRYTYTYTLCVAQLAKASNTQAFDKDSNLVRTIKICQHNI